MNRNKYLTKLLYARSTAPTDAGRAIFDYMLDSLYYQYLERWEVLDAANTYAEARP